MKLLTINTGKCDGAYRARLRWLAAELCRLAPDIVCCQEVFVAEDGSADTASELAERLGMQAIVAPARYKVRECEGRAVAGWSGLALLGRQPWQRADLLSLPSDERDGERIALIGVTACEGTPLVVANVHLTHLRDADVLRSDQLRSVLSHPLLRQRGAVRLLCGDFNTTPDGPVVAPILAGTDALSLRDVYLSGGGAPPQGTLVAGNGRPGGGPRIDLIPSVTGAGEQHPRFCDSRVVLNRRQSGTRLYPSDHFGVMTTMK